MPNLLELWNTKDFLDFSKWIGVPIIRVTLKLCVLSFFYAVMCAFNKGTILESHRLFCHVKVILVVMQDYRNFQCHIEIEILQ